MPISYDDDVAPKGRIVYDDEAPSVKQAPQSYAEQPGAEEAMLAFRQDQQLGGRGLVLSPEQQKMARHILLEQQQDALKRQAAGQAELANTSSLESAGVGLATVPVGLAQLGSAALQNQAKRMGATLPRSMTDPRIDQTMQEQIEGKLAANPISAGAGQIAGNLALLGGGGGTAGALRQGLYREAAKQGLQGAGVNAAVGAGLRGVTGGEAFDPRALMMDLALGGAIGASQAKVASPKVTPEIVAAEKNAALAEMAAKAEQEANPGLSLRDRAAEALRNSATKSVVQTLGPTTKNFKGMAESIAPQILERPLKDVYRMSKVGLEDLTAARKEAAGEAIGAFGKLEGDINPQRIVKSLEDLKKPYVVDGKVIDQGALDRIQSVQEVFNQYGDSISKEGLREIGRTFGKQIAEAKGHFTDLKDASMLDLKKTAASEMREILAEAEPDLARLNKEYSFFTKYNDIITATNQRVRPQAGALSNVAAIAGAATGTTAGGAIAKALTFKWAVEAIRSPGYKLLSAKAKNMLADAIASGKPQEMGNAIKKVGLPAPVLPKGPSQAELMQQQAQREMKLQQDMEAMERNRQQFY